MKGMTNIAAFASVFLSVVLPILVVVGAGYVLQLRRPVPREALSTALLYLFAPALVFSAMVHNPLTLSDLGAMGGFSATFMALTWIAVFALGKSFRWGRAVTTAVLLGVILPNTGNFGASAALFAWGDDGFQKAIVFMAIQFAPASLVAIYACARERRGTSGGFKTLLSQPILYAAVAAGIVRALGLQAEQIPGVILKPIDLLGDANIPVALVLLGMNLAEMKVAATDRGAIVWGTLLKLLAVPALLIPLPAMMGAEGTLANVLVLQAATPTAVNAVVYASEFDVRPDLVSLLVVVTTLGSIATMTALLAFLGV